MNILHISDLHFGPRHWKGNDKVLLEKINSYSADIVINTGDNTTDALESEFQLVGEFLNSIKSEHVISIVGNHDKRNMTSPDFFQRYINKVDLIVPEKPEACKKNKIFLDAATTDVKQRFTDINFLKQVSFNGESFLFVCLDTNELYKDNGYVDEEVLRVVSSEINKLSYDNILLMNHHSILETDDDPLFNSFRVIDFVKKHNIKLIFCGHTHKLSVTKYSDLYANKSFTQYKNGTLSAHSQYDDTNMFLYYENVGKKDMAVYLIRIRIDGDQLSFEEELIPNG